MTQDRAVHERLEGAVAQRDVVISDLRRCIFCIRWSVVGTLRQALAAAVAETVDQCGMTITIDAGTHVASRLEEHGEDLGDIVREALSNAGRHGHATTGHVSLRDKGGRAVLEVDGDGGEFDVERTTAGHDLSNLDGGPRDWLERSR